MAKHKYQLRPRPRKPPEFYGAIRYNDAQINDFIKKIEKKDPLNSKLRAPTPKYNEIKITKDHVFAILGRSKKRDDGAMHVGKATVPATLGFFRGLQER